MAWPDNFACDDECEYSAVKREHLWRHYSVRHSVNKMNQNMSLRDGFSCEECHYNTVHRQLLWRHYSVRHSVNKLQHERLHCDECDRPFQVHFSAMQSAQLGLHVARKHGSEAFRQKILRNRQIYREKRNFACDECKKAFGGFFLTNNRRALTEHIARNHGRPEFRDIVFGSWEESRVCDDCGKLFRGIRGSRRHAAFRLARHWKSSHAPAEHRHSQFGGRCFSDPSARCDDCLTGILGRRIQDQFRHWLRIHANSSSGLLWAAELRKKKKIRKVQCDPCGVSIHRRNLYVHWHGAHCPSVAQ